MTQPKNPSDQKTETSPETTRLPNETPFNAVQNENDTAVLKKNIESAPTIPTEANLNNDVDLEIGSEAKKSNQQLPNATPEKGEIKRSLATYERSRPISLIVPKYQKDVKKYLSQVQLNKHIPMDDQMREYDVFRYGSTNLTENRSAFEKDKKDLENSLDGSARVQTSVDLFDKSIAIPTYPNKRPLSTVPLAQEEKRPYLLKYLNNHLSLEEAKLFQKQILSDLDYSERIYLKCRIPNESALLKNKKHLSLSPAFDHKYMYYNVTSHYEGMAWLVVMATWFFALMSILQRKEK
jgi:hypothetical protein